MLTNVMEIDTSTYQSVIEFVTTTGGNLIVLGQAGIGKTEIPYQVAMRMGLQVVYWNLSTQEAPDLVGLPIIVDKNGVSCVEYASPTYLPVTELTPLPVLVLIDEIDKAKPEIQNPLLEVLQSHTLQGRPLNIKCIVATGNMPDENAYSKTISHALTNRCMIYKLQSNFEPWSEWAVSTGLNPLVVAFLQRNREYLNKASVVGDPTAYTRCSPRAWSLAARDLDKTGERSDVDFQTLLVSGRVGTEAAAKFRVWLDHYRHIEPAIDDLVKKGKMPNMEKYTTDRVMVMAVSACAYIAKTMRKEGVSKEKLRKELTDITTNVFRFLAELTPEYQFAAVKPSLTTAQMITFQLTKIPEVAKVYENVRISLGIV